MKASQQRQAKAITLFITDCEGPISKNDNAYDLTEHFIPQGDAFFALISKYDDVQADIVKRPGCEAGDTLRLILPFLKVYGATNEKIRNFSAKKILLVPGAKATLQFVKDIMPSFIVSTSYEQYIHALCDVVDFPSDHVYCTRLNLDKYKMNQKEIERLKQLKEEMVAMSMIEIPNDACSMDDFSTRDEETIRRLDEIFWGEISQMECYEMLEDVNPVGGFDKAKAIKDIVEKTEGNLRNAIYVGDSITDVQSLQLVKGNEGLAISFNGNNYSIREAEIAVLSDNTIVTSILADVFSKHGKDHVMKLVEKWNPSSLRRYCTNKKLLSRMFGLYPKVLPQVEIITSSNKERLMKESSVFRKTVRGEAIGRLG